MDFNFMNSEDRENVEKLNDLLGTNHRTKPYDIKNDDDLIEMTKMITAEYVDMSHYWSELANLEENFDESLEIFNPAGWVNIGLKGSTNDDIIDDAISSLKHTTNLFGNIMDKSEEKCINVWRFILKNPIKKVHKCFFGKIVNYNEEVINNVLSEDYIFEVSVKINYDGIVENSVKGFAENLLKALKSKAEYNF